MKSIKLLTILFIYLVLISVISIQSAYAFEKHYADISLTGEYVADSITINGVVVEALYNYPKRMSNPGQYGGDATYSCAAFVHRFYSLVYGINISGLEYTTSIPLASRGYFSEVSTPMIGDIARFKGDVHWAIVKSVNSDGSAALIQQNAWYVNNNPNDPNNYKQALIIDAINTSEVTFFRWFSGDTTPPIITSARITNKTSTGYHVIVDAVDNIGVTQIKLLTWNSNIDSSYANDHPDVKTAVNGRAEFDVVYSNFPNWEGATFFSNAYAVDAAENMNDIYHAGHCQELVDMGDAFYAFIVHDRTDGYWEVNENKIKVAEAGENNNDPKRVWCFVKQKDGFYTGSYEISSIWNDKCIDIEGAGTSEGTGINLLDKVGNLAQRFYIYKDNTETYPRYSFNSVYWLNALDNPGEDVGQNIWLWRINNTDAQQFRIIKLPTEYIVSFDPNGGECETTSSTVEILQPLLFNNLPVPMRLGYHFIGWFMDDDRQITTDSDLFFTENQTLYAHWEKLDELVLPTDLTTIESEAFYGCAEEYVVIPSSVTSIGSKAFGNCQRLIQIRIFDSTENIDPNVFGEHNSRLTIYCEKESAAHKLAVAQGIHYILVEEK